jgi:uncharacterized protein YxjI
MVDFSKHGELIVRQHVEHLEAFSGLETKNRYSVSTPDGDLLLYAYEESGFLSRILLKKHRPLSIHVLDNDKELVLTASRSFFWFLSHLHIRDGSGRNIGSLRRRLAILNRRFELEDSTGKLIAEMRGPLLRPQTFMIYKSGEEIGRITKKWSGIGKEVFTDADTFRLQIDTSRADRDFAMLMLASALAVDLDFFEGK